MPPRTTIAPTGTISIIAGCSSGIEPAFALAFTRNVLDNERLIEVNSMFEQILKEEGLKLALIEKVAESGLAQTLTEISAELRRVVVTAHEITPEWHIRMQAAFQEYTDNAVSCVTPAEATREDIEKVYRLAYELAAKGSIAYRAGSRREKSSPWATSRKTKNRCSLPRQDRSTELPSALR